MSYLIKDLPKSEKPRERVVLYGVEALSNVELLSILLRCGTKNKSVKDVSMDILNMYDLSELSHINYKSLSKIKGVGEVKAITLVAALEFSKRVLSGKDLLTKIRGTSDVYQILRYEMENELQEKLVVLYLDNRKFVLMKKVLFIGTVNNSNVYPRDIFREGVKCNASGFILVHNHPAGSVQPSYQDVYLTSTMIKLGKMMGIEVVDHVIIGRAGYYSFLEKQGELFEKEI